MEKAAAPGGKALGRRRKGKVVFDPAIHCGGQRTMNGKRIGKRCTLLKGQGTDHKGFGPCSRHTGSTRNGKIAAQKEAAAAAMVTYGIPATGMDPRDAMIELFEHSLGHVRYLEQKVRELEPEALVWGMSAMRDGMTPRGVVRQLKEFTAAPSVWLRQYLQERQLCLDVLSRIVALGLAERQVKLNEQHGQLIAKVIRAALLGAGVDPESTRVREMVYGLLMDVAAGREPSAQPVLEAEVVG